MRWLISHLPNRGSAKAPVCILESCCGLLFRAQQSVTDTEGGIH